jgi:GH15 family glucan-1,4-alpha-glucosidase
MARALGLERARHWRSRAATIRDADPGAPGANAQAFVESLDGEHLDASVLLMAEVGFLPAQDPRFVRTVDALERTLCDGPFMRRYEAADDFGKPETAFNVCSFWRVDRQKLGVNSTSTDSSSSRPSSMAKVQTQVWKSLSPRS